MLMRFYKLANHNAGLPRDVEYPCVGLVRDNWDDYGFRTTYELRLYLQPGEPDVSEIVKILKKGEKNTVLPDIFEYLDESFCSLGQSLEYYQQLTGLGRDVYHHLLIALNDVIYSRDIAAAFESDEGFETSLLRYGGEVYEKARLLFERIEDVKPDVVAEESKALPSEQDIANQLELLAIHRQTLHIYLVQQAELGSVYVPPGVVHGIREAREQIKRIKQDLRNWGYDAENLPSDDESSAIPAPNIACPELSRPVRSQVFICYSHADKQWLDRLHVHLKPLERQGAVTRWDDTLISPGSKWRDEIQTAITAAKVAILLISADFLASDFITTNELPPLLEAAEREGAVILPVILSPCRFGQTETLSQFQAVNPPSEPLVSMRKNRRESVMVKVANAVATALSDRT